MEEVVDVVVEVLVIESNRVLIPEILPIIQSDLI